MTEKSQHPAWTREMELRELAIEERRLTNRHLRLHEPDPDLQEDTHDIVTQMKAGLE